MSFVITERRIETDFGAGAAWSPGSWREKRVSQHPVYPDPEAVDRALRELASLPPLVTSWEVEALKAQLAEAARGERFVLQGGDCAESFGDCNPRSITGKLKVLLQMSLVLVYGLRKRVIRVGRFAGQYAKPRSSDSETRGEMTLPSYRGDLINRPGFTPEDRLPDPSLMLRGYERAALTLNFIRGLTARGFADLHHPEHWDLDFVEHARLAKEYERMVEGIGDALSFVESLTGRAGAEVEKVEFFASHEGLHLPYEEAQTRQVPWKTGWYDLSTHMPWIGMRTAQLDGAHVEYFRGISNPVGIKVGPSMSPDWLASLLEVLDPKREPGRITLIHRFGASRVENHLPPLVEAVRREGRAVVWCCDPMHGNTRTTSSGVKTRSFEEIFSELETALRLHEELGSTLGGVHLELTGEPVTECTGGARGLSESDLGRAYRSEVDPRLNPEQALEIAMLIARRAGGGNGGRPPAD